MRNIFLLALGMAILMLSGCGVATPDTNEVSPPETKKEQPQMVKLGVIAHLSGERSCGEEGMRRYQQAIEDFNIAHTGLHIEITTGDQDEIGIIEKLFTLTKNCLAGVVSVSCGTSVEEIEHSLLERYEAGKRGQLINVGLIVPSTRWLEWRKSIIDAFTENIDAFNKISSTSLIRLKVVDGACEEGWMSTSSPQRVDVYASVVCSMSTGSELEFKRIAHDATQGVLELFPRGALSEEMDIPECRIPPKTPFLRLCGRNPRTLTR